MTRRSGFVIGAVLAAVSAGAVTAGAQVVIDRNLVTVHGQVITQSDVWQVIELELIDGASTPAAVQRALENRVLIRDEAARLQAPAPPEDAVRAARRAWEARVGVEAARGLATRAGVSEPTLDAWFRETAAIQAYLDRRFSGVREPDRARARADWIALLRNREGLPR